MQKVVLDSDIIIDYTRNANQLFEDLLDLQAQKKIQLFIPSVVVAELVSGQETKDKTKLKSLQDLLARVEFTAMDYILAVSAGVLTRDCRPLAITDAMVAATALSLNAKLATRNRKHYALVKGLRFYKI